MSNTNDAISEKIHKEIRRNRILFALFVVASIGALPFFFGRLGILNDAYASRSWPTTSANLETFDALSDSCATEQAGSARSYMCKYRLEYSYTIEGNNYSNDRVVFIGKPMYHEVKSLVDGASPLNIAYQPGNVANSVLIKGDEYHHGGVFVVATELLLGLFFLGGLIWSGMSLAFNKIQIEPYNQPAK